jgi:glutaminase
LGPATGADAAAESPLGSALNFAYEQALAYRDGALADYIPELSRADPEGFGLAIATTRGGQYAVGDSRTPFTIQSVSKAYTYCLAIELAGQQAVLEHVGVEPSGDPFNAIEFDPRTSRPYNPMVNAGAIAITGILHERLGESAFDFILDRFSSAAGRPLSVNEAVYRSERDTGHRNRAIGHLLLAAGAIRGQVDAITDLYFRQCSIEVTAEDLAWMSATMANLGEHPVTEQPVFNLRAVRDTQAVMLTCGMYDYSGNWAYNVGVPSKSGVGGGIAGVVNRQIGIGAYSPRLDANGNSVRGIKAFEVLAEELGLHAFDCTNTGSSIVGQYLRQ